MYHGNKIEGKREWVRFSDGGVGAGGEQQVPLRPWRFAMTAFF
jgi:hypothetical protein